MPSLTSPFHKLPTTLHTATALPAAPSELLCHVALFNHSVKQSGNNAIVAVLHNPAFASALLGHISTAKALLFGAADHTHFISAVNMFFVDQVDFPWITEQQGLFDTLSLLLTSKILDCSIGDNSTMAKAFFSFADAVIQIEGNHCEACKKELDKLHSSAIHKPGSDAVLTLLSQVDATLKAAHLSNNPSIIPCANLQKYKDTIELIAQQHLFTLDLSLQTFLTPLILRKLVPSLAIFMFCPSILAYFSRMQWSHLGGLEGKYEGIPLIMPACAICKMD
ncbi:hypothetical protein C0989_006540 [Termitomyces sp. Mn162]|nr:hypothetical protein C0989_006540 [Termitomyces sp. Mn162]